MTANLRRKLGRDLRQNLVQFLAIFLMCFLALFVLQAFDSDLTGIGNSVDEFYRDTNFADLIIGSDSFTSEDLWSVKNLPSVRDAELRASMNGKVWIRGEEKKLEFSFLDENDVSGMLLSQGEPYESGAAGIWISRDFAIRQKISVGDELQLKCDGVEFSEKVKGIIDNPDHFYFIIDGTYTDPEIGEYGYAFLSSGEYPGDRLVYDRIYVDLSTVDSQMYLTEADKALIDHARIEISSVLSKNTLVFVPKQKESGFESVYGDLESDRTLSMVFPLLFIVIALLGIMTTMTRMVMKQRTIIGTLKALGFGNIVVTLHYLSYSMVVSFLGSVAGAVTGWYTLGKYIHNSMDKFYSNPYSRMELSWRVVLVIVLIVISSGVTNYVSCRKLLIQNASEILRPEPPAVMGAGYLEKTVLWKKLSFATRWNLRDINRNRLRTLGGLFGVLLCSVLLLTAFGANELTRFTETWDFNELTPANYTVVFSSDAGPGTVYDYSMQYKGQMVENTEAEISSLEDTAVFNVTVVGEGNLCHFEDENGEYVKLPDYEAGISYKASKRLGAGVGDLVSFRITGDNNVYKVRIGLIYKSPGTQGIAMKRKCFEQLGAQFFPNVMFTDMTVPQSYVIDREEIISVFSKDAYIKSLRARKKTLDIEVTYIMVVAVMIGLVVMNNLGVMSFMEKTRDIATLKVLGFSTKKIRWILQQQNILITGIGTVAGLLIGSHLLEFMMGQLDADSDFLYKRMSPAPYILAFSISFLLSLAVNDMISSKVKDINMVEALKGVE